MLYCSLFEYGYLGWNTVTMKLIPARICLPLQIEVEDVNENIKLSDSRGNHIILGVTENGHNGVRDPLRYFRYIEYRHFGEWRLKKTRVNVIETNCGTSRDVLSKLYDIYGIILVTDQTNYHNDKINDIFTTYQQMELIE